MNLTTKILLGMVLGLAAGIIIKLLPQSAAFNQYVVNGLFDIGGQIFIALLEMLVVPIVFVSLVCGTCSLGSGKQLGRLGCKTLLWFIITTIIAVTIGLALATLFHIGANLHLTTQGAFRASAPPSLKQTIINLVPTNPVHAMAQAHLLQLIVFSVLFGIAVSLSGDAGKRIASIFEDVNTILIKLIGMVMKTAPYGVFFLIAKVIANIGMGIVSNLLVYIATVLAAYALQTFGVYSLLLACIAKLNPATFFKKMQTVMLFAFSTSSSNATIPLNLETTIHKLGVDRGIASFVIPLGATINMDGTAIMQGVATVFIAHIYHIHLTFITYLMVILTATLASIGTAGVPGVGMITLAMVLEQAGLPLQGIGLIFGVDRILDMIRTAINCTSDTVVSCLIAKSEKALDQSVYTQ